MNNYIPLNKAVNPQKIYQGYEPLIIKTNGVDKMTIKFDGTPSDYATCAGAERMYIKIEKDGLYYFGVEADDSGSISINREKVCEKNGNKPNGKLNLATDSMYLKAGYYRVELSYTNNAYDPTSNNAIAFNVTMDDKPIQPGKYTAQSTMNREFSESPKIELWTIEKESDITCEPSKEVNFEFEKPELVVVEEEGNSQTASMAAKIVVTACKDEAANVWRCRVVSASGGAKATIRTGGYIDASINPPHNENFTALAVIDMNGYQSWEGLGVWHTKEASIAHEEHHRRQYEDAYKFYWKNLKIQKELEEKTLSCDKIKDFETAVELMGANALNASIKLTLAVLEYTSLLPDDAGSRPYCAGQKALNNTTFKLIQTAIDNGWDSVPKTVTEPGTIEPPCFLPPVSEGETRSIAMVNEPEIVKFSVADTSQFTEGKITVCFRNQGNQIVRILDKINDKTSDFFFVTVLRNDRGDLRLLNAEVGKMTFGRSMKYRELAPGQEYHVTIPVHLDEIELEDWKQCSCELETRYYNQQGKDCFLGTLQATSQIVL